MYIAAEVALENDDFDDASLLASRADKIYEEAENVDILIEGRRTLVISNRELAAPFVV